MCGSGEKCGRRRWKTTLGNREEEQSEIFTAPVTVCHNRLGGAAPVCLPLTEHGSWCGGSYGEAEKRWIGRSQQRGERNTRGHENVNGENPRYARKKKLKREKKTVELVL